MLLEIMALLLEAMTGLLEFIMLETDDALLIAMMDEELVGADEEACDDVLSLLESGPATQAVRDNASVAKPIRLCEFATVNINDLLVLLWAKPLVSQCIPVEIRHIIVMSMAWQVFYRVYRF